MTRRDYTPDGLSCAPQARDSMYLPALDMIPKVPTLASAQLIPPGLQLLDGRPNPMVAFCGITQALRLRI
jgi:hypothetical protein